jgi:hypothetical protein
MTIRWLAVAGIMAAILIGLSASIGSASRLQSARSLLVGRWQRLTTCRVLVGDLKQAGLGATVAQAWLGQTSASGQSSFKPGSPKPTRAHPCRGAIARKHSHFFTASGEFGLGRAAAAM